MGDRVAVMRKGELQQVASPQELYDRPGQHVRRRLHRQPGDEHARGANRAAGRRARRRWSASRRSWPRRRDRREALGSYACAAARRARHPARRTSRTPRSSEPEPTTSDPGSVDAARGARGRGARPLHDRRAPGSDRRDARAGRGRRRRPSGTAASRRAAARRRRDAGRPLQPANPRCWKETSVEASVDQAALHFFDPRNRTGRRRSPRLTRTSAAL